MVFGDEWRGDERVSPGTLLGAEYGCLGLTLGGVTLPPPMYLGLAGASCCC